MGDEEELKLEREYAEFIEVTRKHQTEREKQKRLARKKNLQPDREYYIDISQLDTLTQDNLVEAPSRGKEDDNSLKLVKLYGGIDAYEKIHSIEMNIDEYFRQKCKELSPHYWPVIPINPRPYLSPVKDL